MNITLGAATTLKAVTEAVACAQCGNAMEPKTHGGPQKRYCVKKCKWAARHARKREARLAHKREYHARNRAYLAELKAKPCTDCGKRFEKRKMEWDHVPELGPKIFNAGDGVKHSRAVLDAEIAKCELVCVYCHRARTKARGQSSWRKRKAVAA